MKKLIFILSLFVITGLSTKAMTDIETYRWEKPVKYLISEGIINGYLDGTYKPMKSVNRAEFVKIVVGSLFEKKDIEEVNRNCFSDVPPNSWFAPYVCIAKEEGIIEERADGIFNPDKNINQAEALKILYEAFNGKHQSEDDAWYQVYFDQAQYDGMLYFSPENPAIHIISRGEMAYFTAYFLNKQNKREDQISSNEFPDQYRIPEISEKHTNTHADNQEENNSGGDAFSLLTYRIENDNFTLIEDLSLKGSILRNSDKRDIILKRFMNMIPSSYREEITTFKIFDDANDDSVAFARENDETLTNWTISFNIDGVFNEDGTMYDKERLSISLVHEFAHVLTLNATQLTPLDLSNGSPDCGTQLYTGEGCAKPGSIIDLFYKKFWEEDYKTVGAKEDGDEELYEEKPDSFIRYYAATSPSEDIAESFAYFAVKDKPSDATLIKNQKILFFYQYPELVSLRNSIQKELK